MNNKCAISHICVVGQKTAMYDVLFLAMNTLIVIYLTTLFNQFCFHYFVHECLVNMNILK